MKDNLSNLTKKGLHEDELIPDDIFAAPAKPSALGRIELPKEEPKTQAPLIPRY